MSDVWVTALIAPVSITIVGAIITFFKYQLNKYDKQRNKRRDEIEKRIAELESDNLKFQSILLGCEHPDCPAKVLLSEYYKNKILNKQ